MRFEQTALTPPSPPPSPGLDLFEQYRPCFCWLILLFFAGRNVCGYPGCSKKCYVEPSGRVHDYCSKTHASEHKVMQDRAQRHHWQQQKPGSSHHGNSHHNHPAQQGIAELNSKPFHSVFESSHPIGQYNIHNYMCICTVAL